MKKYLNWTTNALCVFQQLEIEIVKVQQVVQYLENEDTQHNYKISDHVRRYLKERLNILYQAQALLSLAVAQHSLTIQKHLQVNFSWYTGRINTPVEVQLLKHGAAVLTFLVKSVSPLSAIKKGDIQQYGNFAEIAATLCDGSYLTVPTNTLIVCPVSKRAKKRLLKKKESQNESTETEPSAATTAAHNANGVLDDTDPVAVSVSKNNSHSASDVDVAASFVTSGNGGSDASNLPPPNNSEEPLPLELHSTTIPTQWQLLECDTIPVTTPSQDTVEHNVSGASHQQTLYNTVPLGQLKMETQAIASFSTELSADLCQEQSNPSSSPPISPLAPTNDPVQESSRGQSDVTMLSTTCHADEVISEEQLVISAEN